MKNSRTIHYVFGLIITSQLLLFCSLQAQQLFVNAKFRNYTTRSGLSANNQSCIVQDSEGFIWIGTADGLNRFDGYTFKVYRKKLQDTHSLQSNVILSLCIAKDGTLWVGTSRGGLSRYNRKDDNFTTYQSDFYDTTTLASNIVTSIAEDDYQQLWIGTYEGLTSLDRKTNQLKRYAYDAAHRNESGAPAYNQISTLTLNGNTLWIGYYSGTLSSFDIITKQFVHYNLFEAESRDIKEFKITAICNQGNVLWITTWGKGIWTFNTDTHIVQSFHKSKYQYANHIFSDNDGNLWIATEADGIIVLQKDGKLLHYKHDDLDEKSLSTNCIGIIFQDQQDNIWVGNKRGSLEYLVTKNLFQGWRKNPGTLNGLMGDNISSVMEDHKHRLWIGFTDGGLEIIDLTGRRKNIRISEQGSSGLNAGTINALLESHDGTIWVGTFLGGLKRYNESTGTFISFTHNTKESNSISCNNVRQIGEDGKGNLWLALHGGGLCEVDLQMMRFKTYRVNYNNKVSTINSDWLLSLLCNGDDIWVGTVSGISIFHTKQHTITHIRNNPRENISLSNENINTMYKDYRGSIWIGTDDGLNKMDSAGNIVRIYNTQNGLPHNTIKGILEDKKHNLWISTGQGLSRYTPTTDVFKNYFVEDGLETDEFLSCFKNSYGKMYFGGMGGLSSFQPDSLHDNNFVPLVYISDFKLFNKSITVATNSDSVFLFTKPTRLMKQVTLAYDQNMIGFQFVALDYMNAHRTRYAYKLEGFDKNWISSATRREANYTNLHPGTYTFSVKAANADGRWSKKKSFRIIVKPPFWKTGWAYIGYVLLVALFLYGFWIVALRYASMIQKLKMEELEIEKLKKSEEQKMDFFSNISHEFRTPLTLIIGPIENLMKSVHNEFNTLQLQIISRNANRLLRLINQLLDFSKLENKGLKLEHTYFDVSIFITTVSLFFMSEALQRNINFKINTPDEKLLGWFDRDKLEKILFNIIGNAFKFTADHGAISITISQIEYNDQAAVKITVADTGIGIAVDDVSKIFDRFYQAHNKRDGNGSGIGLSLAKALVTLHNGEIIVESEVGAGSRFYIVIPLQKRLQDSAMASHVQGFTQVVDNDENFNITHRIIQANIENKSKNDRPRLLIIDDSADMRLFVKYEFNAQYQISEAADGLTGFEKACIEIPDIIICDIMMPNIDGIALCRKIRDNELTSHIPLIMLTARSTDDHVLQGLESGANDYITKPFTASILKVKIKNLIKQQQQIANRFSKHPNATMNEISLTPVDQSFLIKAYKVVEDNLSNQNLDAEKFSISIGISRAQLYRKIQALSGQSVKEFIRIIRLKKAAEILIKGDLNISQVAFDVGFNSVAYFTKSFSNYFGVTPSKYIANHRIKNTAATY